MESNIQGKIKILLNAVSSIEVIRAIGQTGDANIVPTPGESDVDIFLLGDRIPSSEERKAVYDKNYTLFEECKLNVCEGGDWGAKGLMEQNSPIQSEPAEIVRTLFRRAAEEYRNCIVDDFPYQTNKIKKVLGDISPVDSFDRGLFLTIIRDITIYNDGTLRFMFINGEAVETAYKSRRQRRN